jgi:prepilin-type N-terminal cleavage/methylation domain-containing protein
MKKKGFTLIELLVVISIIAMLLAILMPALSKVKKIAARVVCGTNLKGLGTAQTVYAHDYNDQYTVQGGKTNSTWSTDGSLAYWESQLVDWSNASATPEITVGASLYLLVREADVSPKSFICPAGSETVFDGKNPRANQDLTQLWDFGGDVISGSSGQTPVTSVSYAYHSPYKGAGTGVQTGNGSKSRYAGTASRSSSFAIMSDKSPFFDAKLEFTTTVTQQNFMDKASPLNLGSSTIPNNNYDAIEKFKVQVANSQPHDRDGQNVVYADGHSSYETRSDVGTKNDNIYTTMIPPTATENQWRIGQLPTTPQALDVRSTEDTCLVNDKNAADPFP